jgi:hypothetical protein
MGLVERARKWLAMRRYMRRLPAVLVERYGIADSYPVPRVRAALEASGLGLEYAPHAYAMFATPASFSKWWAETRTAGVPLPVIPVVPDAGPFRTSAAPAPEPDDEGDDPEEEAEALFAYRALRADARRYNGGDDRFVPGDQRWRPDASTGLDVDTQLRNVPVTNLKNLP